MINYNMSQRITKVLGLIALTGLSGILSAQPADWGLAGPIYNAGRARNMIVDKTNSQTLYVGSTSSGIFKSVNGGSKWAPINDQATIRNISYLAQSFDGTIYAGTGEGFLRAGQKAKAQPGTGLYKLDITGNLVSVVSSSVVGTVINRVACDPNVQGHIALATNLGIFVSTDGTTFNLANGIPTSTNVSGQDVKFDLNGILYCTVGNELGATPAQNATQSKVFKASDANFSSFSEITPQSSLLPDNNYGRIELATSPSNANVIYASCASKYTSPSSATLKGLFVSYNGGSSWGLILQGSAQLDPLFNGGTRASGDYAHTLLVDPSNPDILYVGGYSFYVFKRTGGSNSNPIGDWVRLGQNGFSSSTYYLHENIHDIKIINGSTTRYYFVTDAGIYRSSDLAPLMGNLAYNASIGQLPSFQPFYKGMVTGQFNSVSIERYPIGENTTSTSPGAQVNPYSGFIGGTGGNGLTYYSGKDTLVTNELSYLGGDVYNAEYSKILSNAAFATIGDGRLYRSTNVKISDPTWVNVNSYSGALSKIAPDPGGFTNTGITTGTPFRLWESYGQLKNTAGTSLIPSPDSAVFYNDTLRALASLSGVQELTTKTTFTFAASRPNKYALIDSICIRTGTVQLPLTGTYANLQTPFNATGDRTGINIKLPNNYAVGTTTTALSSTLTTGPISGPATVTLDAGTLTDNISVTFSLAPFATKTITQYPAGATGTNIIVADPASYYKVFATIFYKYKTGDIVNVIDNNISTKTTSYTAVLTRSLNWAFGSQTYTLSVPVNTAITSPTYVLNPGNVNSATPSFTVASTNPAGASVYTVRTFGTYTLNALPVNYTLVASTNTAITSPTYILNPGNVSQSNPTFVVSPTVATTYTLTEVGSGTLTQVTTSAIASSSYAISSSSVNQSGTQFVVSPTVTTTYTLSGISSNTLIGANTSTTSVATASANTFTVGSNSGVPMAPNNPPIKIPTVLSARLAMILTNLGNTANANAVVVAKNPLALNDPLNLVRISQSGCYTDDASGNPTTNTISIPGKPILLEWSKGGTELYYATNDNKLYRVSHITSIMDLAPYSYSGKFYTDVFKYTSPIGSASLNPVCPYRTTLVGQFESPISSISVSKDDKNVMVTLNPTATPSSTSGLVMYSKSADIRKAVNPVTDWDKKDQGLSNVVTYCSMMEKQDSKKVFVGTDNGLFYTSDITTGSWSNVSDMSVSSPEKRLPKVQIFDIEQQVLDPNDCYNSGQIFLATNGRGVWTNKTFFSPYAVGVEEIQEKASNGNNLSLYPNPTNGNVTVSFKGTEGENAKMTIMDLSGRTVQSENLGKLTSSDVNFSFETAGLGSGVYLVNISSDSGVKRVAKLVVTK